ADLAWAGRFLSHWRWPTPPRNSILAVAVKCRPTELVGGMENRGTFDVQACRHRIRGHTAAGRPCHEPGQWERQRAQEPEPDRQLVLDDGFDGFAHHQLRAFD